MKQFDLVGTKRTVLGKKASKELRKQDIIPCVLYGTKKDADGKVVATEFQVNFSDVRKLIYTPDIFVVNLTIDGQTTQCVMRELQFHPVKDNVLHIDFYEVTPGLPLVMEVPVKFEGHAAGVRAGGVLFTSVRKLAVKAVVENIPEKLVVDVTPLEIGKTIKVADLHYDGMEIVTTPQALVCGVKATRGSQAQS